MKELHELVAESVSQYPNNVAVVFDSGEGEPSEQQRITYRQLWQQVTEVSQLFCLISSVHFLYSVLSNFLQLVSGET